MIIKLLKLTSILIAVALLIDLVYRSTVGFHSRVPNFFEKSDGSLKYGLKPGTYTYWHRNRLVNVSVDDSRNRVIPGQAFSADKNTIWLIGDSQVFGWGLDDSETISAHLQKELGETYQVINLGMPGQGPMQYWKSLQRVAKNDKVVVIYNELNDGHDTFSTSLYGTPHCGMLTDPNRWVAQMPCWFINSGLFSAIIDLQITLSPSYLAPPLNCNRLTEGADRVIRSRVDLVNENFLSLPNMMSAAIPWDARFDIARLSNYQPSYRKAECDWGFPDMINSVEAFYQHQNPAALFQVNDHHLSVAGAKLLASEVAKNVRLKGW